MKLTTLITNKVLAHPAWAGVASIVAVIALATSLLQINGDKPAPNIDVSKNKWITELRHNPIIPGIGVAGLKIGDSEQKIQKLLGAPTKDTNQVVGGDGEIYLDDRKGAVLHYSTWYEHEGLFLGIYTDSDTRAIKSFRLSDKSFNKDGILPSYKGITIGSTKGLLIKQIGEPLSISHQIGCPGVDNKDINNPFNDIEKYHYSGIEFEICGGNNLISLVDIKKPNK